MEKDVNPKGTKLREQFKELEQQYEERLKEVTLSDEDMKIVDLHRIAVQNGHFTYDDPLTGYRVMTRLRHFLRGSCCGNACRHCVYEHKNVPETKKLQRLFNGAFWIDKEKPEDDLKLYSAPPTEKNSEDFDIEEKDPSLFKH